MTGLIPGEAEKTRRKSRKTKGRDRSTQVEFEGLCNDGVEARQGGQRGCHIRHRRFFLWLYQV
jgi:hypothetical protein